jgi:hypothetical protein
MINILFGTVQKTAMAAAIKEISKLDSSAAGQARFSRPLSLRRGEG